MIFEIFLYTSQNSPKYFSKISKLFVKIIFRNFPKYFSKVSEVFLEFFPENFEIIFEIFGNNSQNFPKYFSKCYETILEILCNNYRNFPKLFRIILNILVIFFVTFRNISGSFQKISEIIFVIVRNDLVLKIFRNTRKCSKYEYFSKSSEIF